MQKSPQCFGDLPHSKHFQKTLIRQTVYCPAKMNFFRVLAQLCNICLPFVSIFSHTIIYNIVHKSAYVILCTKTTCWIFLFLFCLNNYIDCRQSLHEKMHSDGLTDTVIDSRKVQQYILIQYTIFSPMAFPGFFFSLFRKKICRGFFFRFQKQEVQNVYQLFSYLPRGQ